MRSSHSSVDAYCGYRQEHDHKLLLAQYRVPDKHIGKSDQSSSALLDKGHIRRKVSAVDYGSMYPLAKAE